MRLAPWLAPLFLQRAAVCCELQEAARGFVPKQKSSRKRKKQQNQRKSETPIPGLPQIHVHGSLHAFLYWQLCFSEEPLSRVLSGDLQSCDRKTKPTPRAQEGDWRCGRIWFCGCSSWRMAFSLRDVLLSMFSCLGCFSASARQPASANRVEQAPPTADVGQRYE